MSLLLNLEDYEREAAKSLEPMVLGYYRSGADAEITRNKNKEAWQDIFLRPHGFAGVQELDLSTTVLEQPISFPVMVAPMAFQQLAHPQGEKAAVQGVGKSGTIYCLSTISNIPMEEVLKSSTGPVWFQLYVDRERQRALDLVQRAAEAGCSALVVTVDSPVIGNREIDRRLGFVMPSHLRLPNLPEQGRALTERSLGPGSALANFAKHSLDPSLTWKDLEQFAAQSTLPIVVKGVLRGDDARKAIDHGAQAVVVSNHGGRQLDTAIPTAWALPEVVDAVGADAEVYVDGGIRRGTDILKALAMGARAVLVGRPVLWGLSLDGADGVHRILEILHTELQLAMALSGTPSLEHITTDLLWKS